MLGRPLEPSVDAPPTLNFGSLKRHKTLPRRSHVATESTPPRLTGQDCGIRHRSDQITYSSADRIKSWIPDVHIVPVIGKPLTPPINFRDDFQSWIDDAALRKREFVTKKEEVDSSGPTPLVNQSPPTPENTPPKKIHRAQAIASISRSDIQESRTESFKTAKEDQSSDDEGSREDSPSLHPSRQKWLRNAGLAKHKNVGLGLGLESEDEEPTLSETTPKGSLKGRDFVAFDGAWDAGMGDSKDVEVKEDPLKPVSHNTDYKRAHVVSEPTLDSPTLGTEPVSSLNKSLSLRHRVEKTRPNPRKASLERFAEQIKWPLKDEDQDRDSEIREMNNNRLSQASTTSTIVEAMVINSPPRRRQTLRRTSRMPDLNTPPQQSNRNSLVSNDFSLRRRLRRSESPDQELRKSFAESPDSILPSVARSQQDNGPAIPNRRSSLQSSASGSKGLSRTFSLASKQQSSRPTTAPEESIGYFDIPRPRDRRTMSIVIHTATPVKTEDKAKEVQQPISAKADSSPPSAPTSTEEPSTSTSITSTGLDAFYTPATPNAHQQPTLQLADAQELQILNADRPGTGEWSAMRPRSTMVTPFSLRSAHSSTPGTLEVNEATAISIYPHTNKSILVIQQMAGGSSSSPPERSAIIAGNANIALPASVTPVIQHDSPPRGELNSPLQNPRDPPQPPDFKIIPPTPANAPPSDPDIRRSPPRSPTRPNRLNAPMSTLKRAISARRPRSESFVAPFTRNFSLRGTAGTSNHRRTQTADEADTRLHPFWRPRGYEDGDSDSDSEFGNTGVLHESRMQAQPPSNWDGPPRRTMSLTRRFTDSMRLHHPARRPRPASMGHDQLSDFRRSDGGEEHNQMTGTKAPRQGYNVQSARFRQFAEKLERRREAKEEGKREARRKVLRGKIGVVNGNADKPANREGVIFSGEGGKFW